MRRGKRALDRPGGLGGYLWRRQQHGALALLLAHLLIQCDEWRRRQIRILCTLPPKADSENMTLELLEILDTAHIEASAHVYITDDPHWEIAKQTGDSAGLYEDFTPPDEGAEKEFLESTTRLMQIPIDMILVNNTGGVSLEA